jgi:UV DNA damage endonuclease
MSANGFDGSTKAFLEWFKSLPGSTFSEHIEISDLRGRNAGRGIGLLANELFVWYYID